MSSQPIPARRSWIDVAKTPLSPKAVKARADNLAARAAAAAAIAEKALADELKAKYGFDPTQAGRHDDGTYTCEWGLNHYDDDPCCCHMCMDDDVIDEDAFRSLMKKSPLAID
jgi:hypothetical protein